MVNSYWFIIREIPSINTADIKCMVLIQRWTNYNPVLSMAPSSSCPYSPYIRLIRTVLIWQRTNYTVHQSTWRHHIDVIVREVPGPCIQLISLVLPLVLSFIASPFVKVFVRTAAAFHVRLVISKTWCWVRIPTLNETKQQQKMLIIQWYPIDDPTMWW